jgi:hypothetical protein
MEVDGEVRSEGVRRLSETSFVAITGLAADLRLLVGEFELDCSAGRLSLETAVRVRELRERAERIFRD